MQGLATGDLPIALEGGYSGVKSAQAVGQQEQQSGSSGSNAKIAASSLYQGINFCR